MRWLATLALVTIATCGGSGAPGPEGPPVCESGIEVPAGFDPLDTFREPYPDHIGVRLGHRDADGRELHVLVGIPGEFGEAMTSLGDLPLAGGRTGALYAGVEGVWTLVWDEGDVCDPRAVIGNGFTREGFMDALEASGITEASSST